MKRQIVICLALLSLSLISSSLAVAHHSMSMYDQSRSVTLKATVTNYAFTNPHVQIQFQVQDDKGASASWLAECPSPGRLSRTGWSEGTLKPGDQITITGNPAKDGSKEMRLDGVILPNGQQMSAYHR